MFYVEWIDLKNEFQLGFNFFFFCFDEMDFLV